MFRYAFNPYSCQWEIQLLRWGFFWTTLRGIRFEYLTDAETYTNQVGIDTKYQEQRPFNHTPVTKEQADEQS